MNPIPDTSLTARFIAEIQELSKNNEDQKVPKKRMRWEKEQSEHLLKLREENPRIRWESLAQHFPLFKPCQVRRHYYALVNSSKSLRKKKYTKKKPKNGYQKVAPDKTVDDKLQMLASLKAKLFVLEELLHESHSKVKEYFKKVSSN